MNRLFWLFFFLTPFIIIGGIVAGLALLLPRFTTTLSSTASPLPSAGAVASAAAQVDVSQSTAPVPTLQPSATAQFDAEDEILTRLYRERSPAVVAIDVRGN